MFFSLLSSLLFAEEPDKEIVVYGNSSKVVYVSETNIFFQNKINKDLIYSYAHSHKNFAEKRGDYGYYTFGEEIDIYNHETVQFMEIECNFKKTPLKCAYENDMWVLKSSISKDEEQIVISLLLIDESGKILSRSTVTNSKSIVYNKKKKTESESSTSVNCNGGVCSRVPQVASSSRSLEEDLDTEEIIINPKLLEKDLHQASMLLWASVKVNE